MDNDQLGGGGEARVLERALEELKRDTVLAQRRARAYSLTAGLAMGGGGIVLFANLTGRIEINPLFIILIAIIILVIVGFLVISYLNEDVPEILAGAFSAATSILGISISPRRQADDAQGVLKLRAEVARLQQEVQAISTGARRQDFNEVVENLARKVAATASSDLVAHVERRLDLIERSDLYEARHAMEAFGMTRQRIAFALQRLGRRGAVNLTLGGSLQFAVQLCSLGSSSGVTPRAPNRCNMRYTSCRGSRLSSSYRYSHCSF